MPLWASAAGTSTTSPKGQERPQDRAPTSGIRPVRRTGGAGLRCPPDPSRAGGRAVRQAPRLRHREAGGPAGRGRERPAAPRLALQAVGAPQACRLGAHVGAAAHGRRHRRAGRVARGQPRAADARSGGGAQGGRGRRPPRPAALRVGRLPEERLVAPAGQARRAQGALRQPARLRARRRPVAGRRLGGLERAGAEHAVAGYFNRTREQEGWTADRLAPCFLTRTTAERCSAHLVGWSLSGWLSCALGGRPLPMGG